MSQICKTCNKKVVGSEECNKCGAKYHPSCALRIKQCCGLEIKENKTNLKMTEEIFLHEENKLLRQIIEDKDVIINDKEVIITLMKGQIALLEEKLAYVKTTEVSNHDNINKDNRIKMLEAKSTIVSPDTRSANPNIDNSLVQGDSTQTTDASGSVSSISLQQKQLEIMTDIIDLNKNSDINETKNYTEDTKTEKFVQHKYKRNKKYNIGDAEVDKENELECFVGRAREKRIWLFLSNVKDHVTEEMVVKYLESKTREDSIFVKEIHTFRKRKDNKCFKVGISYDRKDEAYTSSFWPKGVTVCRFNFHKEDKTSTKQTERNTNTPVFPDISSPQNFQDTGNLNKLT